MLEKVLREAMLASDVARLDEMIADDLIFTNHLGQLQTKASDLDAHRSGALRLTQLTPLEQVSRIFGDAAVVAVRMAVRGELSGEEFESNFRFTRTWANQDGTWKVIGLHAAVLAPDQQG
jgi:ketosteroid isomerase-like protein